MPSGSPGWPRVDPKLLRPIQHRGEAAQADRALLRSRDALVVCRTKLINHARGIVKSMDWRLPSGSTSYFHKRVRQDLPDELKPALTPVLDTIAALSLRIQRLAILQHNAGRVRLRRGDRIFWVWLARRWSDWRSAFVIVQPDTVV